MEYARKPCPECPWRRDVEPGRFTAERFRALAHTAYDMSMHIFACHKSPEGREFACAGFLLRSSAHNMSVRLARQNFEDVISPWPLYTSYRELAVANGVDPRDPVLRPCRNDGQRQ